MEMRLPVIICVEARRLCPMLWNERGRRHLEVSRNMPILSAQNGNSPRELSLLDVHIGESLLQLRYKSISLKSKTRCAGNSYYRKERKTICGHREHLQYH